MDGTLVDTELSAASSIESIFSNWGYKISPDDAKVIVGRTWAMAFDFLFKKYPPPMSLADAEKVVLGSYRDHLKKGLIEVPGARKCVKNLAKDFPLALVSGSHRAEILFILESLGIKDCFKVILGAEDYANSKPAPDGYQKALMMLGANAKNTLVFEDSEAGIASGLAAGTQVCAITSTNHFSLNTKKAHYFISDLTGVDSAWVRALKVN